MSKSPREPGLVVVARSPRPEYCEITPPLAAPELPGGCAVTTAQATLRELFLSWGLDHAHLGSPVWNPLGELIAPGARVVLKPNWVTHQNRSGAGLDCLITHPSVIDATLDYLALARPGRVTVGDAPIQSCDMDALRASCRLDLLVRRARQQGIDLSVADFRRTIMRGDAPDGGKLEDQRDLTQFVQIDLSRESLLEAIVDDWQKFRVTMYDPRHMLRTHAPGRHMYLIAREVLEADVIINLPKLKCHKKACITGTLKNVVGINGHKEYLPHHRRGGSTRGGDCYSGGSFLKAIAEACLDGVNRRPGGLSASLLLGCSRVSQVLARTLGADSNLEGSWYGNQTVWRTALDLQRILAYGRVDGTMAEAPQRLIISITDGIISGEGEGPMAPTPVPVSVLTGSLDTAAAEWVHAFIMGFDPMRIPIIREAFGTFRFPLTNVSPGSVRVRYGTETLPPTELARLAGRTFLPPRGWVGHCELS